MAVWMLLLLLLSVVAALLPCSRPLPAAGYGHSSHRTGRLAAAVAGVGVAPEHDLGSAASAGPSGIGAPWSMAGDVGRDAVAVVDATDPDRVGVAAAAVGGVAV
ncbi:uncharacterized protein LOC117194431 [Drosophila miranda]|uniref:uncharacterized protein LOC117194431 n=1 Tax=Drosophila miranda TaxID=7229 RepID=UPI00143F8849|nr:uncharacterized protein LOC117194431 [Drosophila miranda]